MTIQDLIIQDREKISLEDVFLKDESRAAILNLIKEHRYIDQLQEYGLPVSNKLLLHGSSGCGKTTTAKAIAHALQKNLLILNLSTIVSSKIGETSQNLKMVFDKAAREKAVLFLDEFDQIGKARESEEKDVGEMRRLVNTLIQLIDYFPQNALLICATNHAHVLDPALVRRFQLKIEFKLPSPRILDKYYDVILAGVPPAVQTIDRKYDISFAEAKDYALTLVKAAFIRELESKESISQSTSS